MSGFPWLPNNSHWQVLQHRLERTPHKALEALDARSQVNELLRL
jgi:hypothetical protein